MSERPRESIIEWRCSRCREGGKFANLPGITLNHVRIAAARGHERRSPECHERRGIVGVRAIFNGESVAFRVRSISSIDGVLVATNGAGDLEFVVQDRFRKQIPCQVVAALLEEALSSVGQRVILRGPMWSRHDGVPICIDVQSLEVIAPDDVLATRGDVRGILCEDQLARRSDE